MKDYTFWRSGDPDGWSSKQVLATFMTISGDLEWVDTRGNTHVGIVCEMEVQTEAPGTATYSNKYLKFSLVNTVCVKRPSEFLIFGGSSSLFVLDASLKQGMVLDDFLYFTVGSLYNAPPK